MRRDFTEMLLEGERRGLPPREVIGPDYQSFCDSVIAEVPGLSGRARLLTPLRDILLCAAVLLGIRLAFRCVDWLLGVEQWPCLTVTLGDAVSAGLILAGAFLLFAVLAKRVFRAGVGLGPKPVLPALRPDSGVFHRAECLCPSAPVPAPRAGGSGRFNCAAGSL